MKTYKSFYSEVTLWGEATDMMDNLWCRFPAGFDVGSKNVLGWYKDDGEIWRASDEDETLISAATATAIVFADMEDYTRCYGSMLPPRYEK